MLKKQYEEDMLMYGFILDTSDIHKVGAMPSCRATFSTEELGTYHLIIPDLCLEILREGDIQRAAIDATFCYNKKGWQVLTIWGKDSREEESDQQEQLLAVALMNAKSEQLYDRVLFSLSEICSTFRPSYFTCDFEHALRNSVVKVFGSVFWGCIFHFMQACTRKMKTLRMDPDLVNCIEVNLRRLAFAPTLQKFTSRLVKLKILLGVEVSADEHRSMRARSNIIPSSLLDFFPNQGVFFYCMSSFHFA
jgi:hypothetical protein